jgi:hypothetical protein
MSIVESAQKLEKSACFQPLADREARALQCQIFSPSVSYSLRPSDHGFSHLIAGKSLESSAKRWFSKRISSHSENLWKPAHGLPLR